MNKPRSASRIKRSRKTMEPRHVQNLGKIALAFFIFLAAPAASFAMIAGEAEAGNLQTSGIPLGPANPGGMNNVLADPSGIENAYKVSQLPLPHIIVPTIPKFKWDEEGYGFRVATSADWGERDSLHLGAAKPRGSLNDTTRSILGFGNEYP